MTDLTPMWDALARYQPYADADGHGKTWAAMCSERTKQAAEAAMWSAETADVATTYPSAWASVWAAASAAASAASAAARAADVDVAYWSALAITRIEKVIKERT